MSSLQFIPYSGCVMLLTAVMGCGPGGEDMRSQKGLLMQIEGAVEDIDSNVSSKYYSGDLGDDGLGVAVSSLQKLVAGTPQEADVEKLAQKVTQVSTLASRRPPIAKLRVAVKELSDVLAEVKTKF